MTQKSDYNFAFNCKFSSCNQNEFEDWFRNMMECIYKGDFEFIKSGGQYGDKKCDGRIISKEIIFQCYAPESPATFAKNAPKKIKDSFPEVLEYWPNIKIWKFIHNNIDGIGTSISNTLEELRAEYQSVKIQEGSRRFLKDLHDQLSIQQMIDIYPEAKPDFDSVQMDTIRPLLKKIEAEYVEPSDPLIFGEDPNPEKLKFNELSHAARRRIQEARNNVSIVERYITGLSIPTSATKIQNSLISKYNTDKDIGYKPDEILGRLLKFTGDDGTATITAAAYVIITYYFDACDIFENIPKDDQKC